MHSIIFIKFSFFHYFYVSGDITWVLCITEPEGGGNQRMDTLFRKCKYKVIRMERKKRSKERWEAIGMDLNRSRKNRIDLSQRFSWRLRTSPKEMQRETLGINWSGGKKFLPQAINSSVFSGCLKQSFSW